MAREEPVLKVPIRSLWVIYRSINTYFLYLVEESGSGGRVSRSMGQARRECSIPAPDRRYLGPITRGTRVVRGGFMARTYTQPHMGVHTIDGHVGSGRLILPGRVRHRNKNKLVKQTDTNANHQAE